MVETPIWNVALCLQATQLSGDHTGPAAARSRGTLGCCCHTS